MTTVEPTMIGVSEATHPKLQRLKEDGHFREMADAYRFGIALALAQGIQPPEISARTVFSVATVDPDQSIRNAISTIVGEDLRGSSVYKYAERLADWGIQELYAESVKGEIDILRLFDQAESVRG